MLNPNDEEPTSDCASLGTEHGKTRSGEVCHSLLAAQRRDWLEGKCIPIAEQLRLNSALAGDREAAAELIYHEFLLRGELGQRPDWDAYLRQFPEHAEELRLLFDADQFVERALASQKQACGVPTHFGGYELLEELGHGGMGVVYKARQKSLDRFVALKMMRTGEFSTAAERRRFEREARAVARLQHPNIVQIYEVGETGGQPFFSHEFVEGGSLLDRIGGTPLASRHAATIVEVLARAMQYAHERGIIHRDLKPSNVLVAGTLERGTPKITDFGVAKSLDPKATTQSGSFMGTPSYMAPEQVEGKTPVVDCRTDVYGLGAILYELLTGRPPFRAESPLATLKQVVQAEPARPRLLNSAVPRDLETVCLKCLHKEPVRRYASAVELAEDLRRFLAGRPVRARRIGNAARAWRWSRRNPVLAGLAGALVAALLGGLATTTYQWRAAEAARQDAIAGDEEAQGILVGLLGTPETIRHLDGPASLRALLKAEGACKRLLDQRPESVPLRIAISNIYVRCALQFQSAGAYQKAIESFVKLRSLWKLSADSGSEKAVARKWIAMSLESQAGIEWNRHLLVDAFQHYMAADAIWDGWLKRHPDDVNAIFHRVHARENLSSTVCSDEGARTVLPTLIERRDNLGTRLSVDPQNLELLDQAAQIAFLLGESSAWKGQRQQALSFWAEARAHLKAHLQRQPNDSVTTFFVAECCTRLLEQDSPATYYAEAAPILENAGTHFEKLLKQNPHLTSAYRLFFKCYASLLNWHVKMGQEQRARQIYVEHIEPVMHLVTDDTTEPVEMLEVTGALMGTADQLKQTHQWGASLSMLREAAAIHSRVAKLSAKEPSLLSSLAHRAIGCAVLFHEFGDCQAALKQAEFARGIVLDYGRVTSDEFGRDESLAMLGERIGKIRWTLGEHKQALAAFQESSAISRRLFEQNPADSTRRYRLRRSYDRLYYYAAESADCQTAAAALVEREKLWPDDAAKLAGIADDYDALVKQIDGRKKDLSASEKMERDKYLAQSRRARQAAEAATRRPDSLPITAAATHF
jgi:tRNA A-37 threonylcarbamoyl transferase component Bud32/tetratricopeptide (TPR) repeat protein